MKLENIPDSPAHKYTERVGVAVSAETRQKLDYLKRVKGKNIPEFLRRLIDDGLKDVIIDQAG